MGLIGDLLDVLRELKRLRESGRSERPSLWTPSGITRRLPHRSRIAVLMGLTAFLALALSSYVYVSLRTYDLFLEEPAPGLLPPWVVPGITAAVWTSGGSLILFCLFVLLRHRSWPWVRETCIPAILIVLIAVLYHGKAIAVSARVAELRVFDLGCRHWEFKQYDRAVEVFESILTRAPDSPLADNALGRIAGARYHQGRYAESAGLSAAYLDKYGETPISDNIRTTLRWALRAYGAEHSMAECTDLLRSLHIRYPRLEVSSTWFVQDSVDDSLPEDFGNLVEALHYYSADLMAAKADLDRLLDAFPNDPLAPDMLLLTGEPDRVIAQYPESPIANQAVAAYCQYLYDEGRFPEVVSRIDLAEGTELTRASKIRLGLLAADSRVALGQTDEAAALYVEFIKGHSADADATPSVSHAEDSLLALVLYYLPRDEQERALRSLDASGVPALEATAAFARLQRALTQHAFADAYQRALAVRRRFADHRYAGVLQLPWLTSLVELRQVEGKPIEMAERLLDRSDDLRRSVYSDFPSVVLSSMPKPFYYDKSSAHLAYAILADQVSDERVLALRARCMEQTYKDLPIRSADRLEWRRQCEVVLRELAQRTVDDDAKARHLSKSGLIYLDDPHDYGAARRCFRDFVAALPHHDWANNCLNWVAWTYCADANANLDQRHLYIGFYEMALETYEEIVREYPYGHVARNAKSAATAIRRKLAAVRNHEMEPFEILVPPELKTWAFD